MFAVQEQTENRLGGTSIIDDLFGEEYFLQTIVFDNGSSWLIVLNPFKEKYQSMNWPINIIVIKKRKNIFITF